MFLGRAPQRNQYEQMYDDVVRDLRTILEHAGIATNGPGFPNWIGDGSVLWKKPQFGKVFKEQVLQAEKLAEVYYSKTYPTANEADLQGLPRMLALRVVTERWVAAHPDLFPGANIKG